MNINEISDNSRDIGFAQGVLLGLSHHAELSEREKAAIKEARAALDRVGTRYFEQIEAFVKAPKIEPVADMVIMENLPKWVTEAAMSLGNWMDENGKKNWQLYGVCDRRFVTK